MIGASVKLSSRFPFDVVLLAMCLPGHAQRPAAAVVPSPSGATWTASWTTSIQGPEQGSPVKSELRDDVTVRQIVHLSAGGSSIRVMYSNRFGTQPLLLDVVAIAPALAPGESRIAPGSSRVVTFAGRPSVLIPVGASFVSDPVALPVAALANVAISFHLPVAPVGESGHPGSRATSFLASGNHVSDPTLPPVEKTVRWFQMAEVDVSGPVPRTVVILGDSVTDGHGATTDGNDRWPDVLAARLQGDGVPQIAVANEGIGGNHLLTDGIGQSALERFDPDVLAVAGVHWVVVLDGINDLGALARTPNATAATHADLVARMEAAYIQLIERAHAHGLKVYGATLTPDSGSAYYHPNAEDEAARQAVNAWIRQPGHFDGFVDFDQTVRDPAHPSQLLPAFDSGDHLHPGPAGYRAMGEAVPLAWFQDANAVR